MEVDLAELGPPLVVEMPRAVATALAGCDLLNVTPAADGRWRLRPAGKVGAVSFEGWDIRVVPKVGVIRLLFLLGYAVDPGFRPDDVAAGEQPDLLPMLGESLARQAERAIGSGVLQGYVTIEDALPLVRGRFRVADQIARRPGLPLPAEVRYDEYSADIVENRILRAALRRMLAVPRLREPIRRRLAHLDGRLDGVSPLLPGAPLPQWEPNRLNARYQPALRLASVVLRHCSAESGSGELRMAAFAVNMAKVFEDFVATAVREAMRRYPGRTVAQYPSDLAATGGIPMFPDVVHVVGNRPVAVLDVKYKMERDNRRFPNADAYQMLAYCTGLDLPRGWLVYAKGMGEPLTHRVVNTSVEIVQHPLDLAASPAGLLAQVDKLASEMAASASLATAEV